MTECKPSHNAPILLWATHDLGVAFDHLISTALLLVRGGSSRLEIAAIAFAAQAAIEAGYDAKTVRAVEEDLIKRFTKEA